MTLYGGGGGLADDDIAASFVATIVAAGDTVLVEKIYPQYMLTPAAAFELEMIGHIDTITAGGVSSFKITANGVQVTSQNLVASQTTGAAGLTYRNIGGLVLTRNPDTITWSGYRSNRLAAGTIQQTVDDGTPVAVDLSGVLDLAVIATNRAGQTFTVSRGSLIASL